ncbi:MAG: hypothetical protein M0Q94_11785 [Candidatus Cloacimonetes bacterium]|nr:hypothetical protein [Candidatus Cloacimonadota bacterium]
MIKNVKIFKSFIKKYAVQKKPYDSDSDWDYGNGINLNQNKIKELSFIPPILDIDKMNETFKIDNLKRYSLEEYISKLKEFPLGIVNHITRHGVRNLVNDSGEPLFSDVVHTGYSGIFVNSFEKILNEKNLISRAQKLIKDGLLDRDPYLFYVTIFGIPMLIEDIEPTTAYDEQCANEMIESRLKKLDRLKETRDFVYLDQLGVHFSVGEEVADGSYGGEYGNQIFIVYPLAMVTSECYFKENWGYRPGNSGMNDIVVINQSGEGIPLEAGIIFLPENAKVNAKNGSLFDIEKNQTMIDPSKTELAKDSISSKTYWERYLGSQPKKNNLKIVWYDAKKRPSKALIDWLKENNLEFIKNPFEESKNDDKYLESLREQFVTHMQRISDKTPGEDKKMQKTLEIIKADECGEILRKYFFEEGHIQDVELNIKPRL